MSDSGFQKLGWWLFVACAVFFIWAGIRAGDLVTILGSLFFLGANIAFMVPVYRSRDPSD